MIGEGTVQPVRDRVEHRWIIGSAVLLAGLGLITAGQWEFGRTFVSTGSRLALVGMALAAVAVWLMSPRPDTETPAPPHLAT